MEQCKVYDGYMRIALVLVFLGSFCCLSGQEGTVPRWEIIELAEDLYRNAGKVREILKRVRPGEWNQAGASSVYVSQRAVLKDNVNSLTLSAQEMIREPEKLSAAINTFLWLERVGSMVDSVAAGVRRYQSTALADFLESAGAKTLSSENLFKQYIRQRAVDQENELAIASDEAQRCRSELLKIPIK